MAHWVLSAFSLVLQNPRMSSTHVQVGPRKLPMVAMVTNQAADDLESILYVDALVSSEL